MPDVAEQPRKHGRSMVGFYIAAGVVAVLVSLGPWLWAPAKIWYYERQVRVMSHPEMSFGELANEGSTIREQRTVAADELVAIGPMASDAVARLLAYSPGSLVSVAEAVGRQKAKWAVPILVEACRKETRIYCGTMIIGAVSEATGRRFPLPVTTNALRVEERRVEMFLAWWEGEGMAEYGGAPK